MKFFLAFYLLFVSGMFSSTWASTVASQIKTREEHITREEEEGEKEVASDKECRYAQSSIFLTGIDGKKTELSNQQVLEIIQNQEQRIQEHLQLIEDQKKVIEKIVKINHSQAKSIADWKRMYDSIMIHKNGYWQGIQAESQHKHDSSLGDSLAKFFTSQNVTSLVDFGCGMGKYVKTFQENNISAIGYDGNPNTPELTNNLGRVLDLSELTQFDEPFDWVMSLEVGEHLPSKFEDIFIKNLHYNNKYGIVLSWARKGQGGDEHVNEQNNDYIKSKICDLGYWNDIESETKLREESSLPWFKETIMVFRKSSKEKLAFGFA